MSKKLLDKHSDSRNQLDTDKLDRSLELRDNQSSTRKRNDRVTDWLLPGQGHSADRQEHVTAFFPWAGSQDPWVGLGKADACALLLPKTGDSSFHSVAVDSSSAIYKKLPDAKAKEHAPRVPMQYLGFETEIHTISMLTQRPGEVSPNQYNLEQMKGTGERRTEGHAGDAQQEPDNVTYHTAQKMLDHFISQIPSTSNERQLQRGLEDKNWTRGPTEGP